MRSIWRSAAAIESTCANGPYCASGCRCRAARAAGSRTGRARRGTRRRSRSAGRARPAARAASGSRSGATRTGRRRRAPSGPRRHAEDRAREPRERRVVRRLVPVAAAIHQVRRPGGADVGVVERARTPSTSLREVLEVHVVDRVRQRLADAERARRAEARAVLDVALLAAVVPVHRRDLVLGRARCRSRSTPRTPASPTGTPRRSRRRSCPRSISSCSVGARPGRDRPLEHRRLQRVDDGEDELLRALAEDPQARVLLALARRRPPDAAATRAPPTTTSGQRREQDREPAATSADALGVERQRARGLGVEPARGRGRRASARRRTPSAAAATPTISPGHQVSPWSASEPRDQQRAEHQRDRRAASTERAALDARAAPAALDDAERRRRRRHREQERGSRGRRSPCPRSRRRGRRRRARRRAARAGTGGCRSRRRCRGL